MLAFAGAVSEYPISFSHHPRSWSLYEPKFSAPSVSCHGQRRDVSKGAAAWPIVAAFAFASACELVPGHRQQRRSQRWPRAVARVQVHAAATEEQEHGTTRGSISQAATYVKVWVAQVCWLGPGALVALDAVYEICDSPLPKRLLAFLDPEQTDEFRRAATSQAKREGFDDALCEVRVHNPSELSKITGSSNSALFGEFVLRQDCPVNWEAAGKRDKTAVDARLRFSTDVLGVQERRLQCSVGEALATSLQLTVPALVCITFLIRAAKNYIDKALLEGSLCRGSDGDDESCDLALYELRYDLNVWLEEAEASGVDASTGGMLLHKIDAFAWQQVSQRAA